MVSGARGGRCRAAAGAALLAAGGLAAALASIGCKEEERPAADAPVETRGDAVGILRKFPASPDGGIREATNVVIADAKTWEETWHRANAHLSSVPKAPSVDFAKERVAFASLGEKPSPGWSVEIVGLRVDEGKFRILYAVREPGAEAPATTTPARPWHAVVVPQSDLPVEWAKYVPPVPKRK